MALNIINKAYLPLNLPPEMADQVELLKQTDTKDSCLRTAYELLTTKYRGYRAKTYTHLLSLFDRNLDKLWARNGFLHCTTLNYLMKILLVKSGKFSLDDIQFKWTQVNYLSPHQYLLVRVSKDKWIDVDLWGKVYGVNYGGHAHGFKL